MTVAPHGSGDTFTIKTLKSMIERQANWTAHDLVRLGLLTLTLLRSAVPDTARLAPMSRSHHEAVMK